MSTCSECDYYRLGGGCDVWIHRKHFEQEANNCNTLIIGGLKKMTDPIVEVFIPNTTPTKTLTLSELAASVGQQVEEKNKAYGDWNVPGQILRLLYPNGVPLEQVDDMLTITRILDKLRRIATKKDAFGESPYRDIAGYALLALKKAEQINK